MSEAENTLQHFCELIRDKDPLINVEGFKTIVRLNGLVLEYAYSPISATNPDVMFISYIGADRCFSLHKSQTDYIWMDVYYFSCRYDFSFPEKKDCYEKIKQRCWVPF